MSAAPSQDSKANMASSHATLQNLPTVSDMQSQVLKARAAEHLATYQHLYSVTDLEEAISMYEEVLRLRPEGHELRAESLNDLGCALHDFCYLHEANETRITRCIELLREGLRLRPPQHPLRDQSLYNLAKSLRCVLYRQVGGLEILKECELLNREALRLRPPGHPDRTYSMNVLANDLGTIVWHTGDTDMQAEMVDMRREVLGMCPPGHPLRDTALENLGYALRINFERMGRSELLAEAISVTREAVQICPLGHPRRGILLSTLSYALMLRYGYEGHAQSLPEAIGLVRGALQLMPDNHPARAGLLSNLAEALLETWRGSRDGNALAEAVSLLREAMALRSPGAESYHTFVNNLAETLEASYNTDGDIKTLSEVTDLYRQALHSRPTGHPLRFLSLEGLARALSKSGSGSWPEVLSCYKEALKICPVGYPARARLLSGMSRCFLDSSSLLFSLSEGISCLSQAYADTLSHVRGRLKSAISDLQQLEAAYGVTTKISHSDNYFDNDERILSLYVQVIHLLPLAANFGLDHGARLQAVAGSDEIARNAAARAVIIGYFPQAVEMLEQGRGVFWTQTLHLRTAAFSGVPQDDYQELKRMLQLLEHGARRVESLQQSVDQREREMEERRRLNEAVQALISKIRGYPGYDRFLLPPAFDALMGSLPEGFVIIVNASKLGNHALLLHRTTGLARTLVLQPFRAGFDCTDLRAQLPRDMSAVSASRQVIDDATRAMRLDSGKTRCFEDVLSLLWTSVVHPIFGALGLHEMQGHARPRLWWCVTGEFGFLPIHAAGSYRDATPVCTADFVVSSYIPTLASLIKARNLWTPIARSDLAGLLICEASTTEGSAAKLSDVVDEVVAVRECFAAARAQVLNQHAEHTSVSEMRLLLEETTAHVLHMACHGVQDSDPLKSAFLLHDGRLSIENIIHLDLPHAFLAFLSACQTAKGDQNAPDQAMHLAASMLFCGFRSVVGTMWSMCDKDGPKVARHFYNSLFERDQVDLDDVAYALDDAVQALRRSGVPASRWAPFMHIGG